jgi:hypothetical protein
MCLLIEHYFSFSKRRDCSPMSLAHLVGHCIIYAGDRDSNPGHPTYSPWNFKPLGYLTKKKRRDCIFF